MFVFIFTSWWNTSVFCLFKNLDNTKDHSSEIRTFYLVKSNTGTFDDKIVTTFSWEEQMLRVEETLSDRRKPRCIVINKPSSKISKHQWPLAHGPLIVWFVVFVLFLICNISVFCLASHSWKPFSPIYQYKLNSVRKILAEVQLSDSRVSPSPQTAVLFCAQGRTTHWFQTLREQLAIL